MPFSAKTKLSPAKRSLRRLSYNSFRLHEIWRGHLQRHILPRGYGALATLVVSAVMCLGNPSATLLQGLALLCAVVMISTFHALSRRASIRVQRSGTSQVVAGQLWLMRIEVQAVRAIQGFRLLEIPPDSHPSFEAFLLGREPYEQRRNVFDRWMAYHRWQWLVQQSQAFAPQHTAWQQQLAAGEKQVIELPLRPQRRGRLTLSTIHVQLPDVFFLFQRCFRLQPEALELLVLARRYPLAVTCFGSDAAGLRPSTQLPSTNHPHGELRGLRPYQMGDSPRQIHWRASARAGKFISKEFEEPQRDHWGLVLDTCGAVATGTFEAAVSVCASLLHAAQLQHHPLAWLHFTHEPFPTPAPQSRSHAHWQRRLAVVEPQVVPGSISSSSAKLPSCLLVTTQWPPIAPQLSHCATDENTRLLYIGDTAPPTLPHHARVLRPSHLARDLLNLRL